MTHVNKEQIIKKWNKNENKFQSISDELTYNFGGIWPTEGFLFCSIAEVLEVDLVIESGMAYGVSTEIWAGFFDCPVISIDLNHLYGAWEETKERLQSKHKNLICYLGDGKILVEKYIQENPGKRIAVFMDGPKGLGAKKMMDELTAKYKEIKMVGYHDFYQNKFRECYNPNDMQGFWSHSLDFINDKYVYLNAPPLEYGKDQIKWAANNGPGIFVEPITDNLNQA